MPRSDNRPEIEVEGRRTRIMVEQTSAAELAEVDGALMDVLGLR